MPVFAIVPHCPVHDNPDRELVIWDGNLEQKSNPPSPMVSDERREADVRLDSDRGAHGKSVEGNKKNHAKTLEGFQFKEADIDEQRVREIHAGAFLDTACNVLFTGGTGTGKTHLALAVAGEAMRRGKHGYFFTAFDLVKKLEYEFQGGAGSFMFDLAQADFVVVDELGYVPIPPAGRALLYHLFARLDEKTSVIVTSHLPMTQWAQVFADPDMTKALVDRFACRCHVVNTGTESWRGSVERTRQTLTRLGNLRETYSTEKAA